MQRTILMNADMVCATKAGYKTQTRRIVKSENDKYPFAETLLVKETHGFDHSGKIVFRADGGWCLAKNYAEKCLSGGKWKPSIFMKMKDARISLDIRGKKLERLQDITEEDAVREGARFIKRERFGWTHCSEGDFVFDTARASFINLWCSIYGADSWDKNPFVWVIDFRAVIIQK